MDREAQIFDRMQLLYAESGFNDHMVHCELSFDRSLDEGRLKKAVALLLESIPILATRYIAEPGKARWESIAGAGLDRAFATVDDGAAFEAERTHRIDEAEGPQLHVGFLRGGQSAIALTVNHMLADGAALKDCAYVLCETYSRLRDDPFYAPPLVDGYRGIADVLGSVGPLDRLRAFFGRGGDSNRAGELSFPLDGRGEERPFIATRTVARERVARLRASCRLFRATINDAVLTAYYRTLSRALERGSGIRPRGRLEVPIMIDMRRYLPSRVFGSLRNVSSTAVTRLETAVGESFEASLERTVALMKGLKSGNIGLNAFVKMSLLASLPQGAADSLMRRGFRHPLICMTNLGELDPSRLSMDGATPVSAYACGSIKHKPHVQLALSGFAGTITLSSNLCGNLEDKRRIEAFLAEVEEELKSFGETGTTSPRSPGSCVPVRSSGRRRSCPPPRPEAPSAGTPG